MKTKKRDVMANSSILILLAADFEEGKTVCCLEHLRQAGISVSLVGLSAGLITGFHGMKIRPDVTLSQLPGLINHKLVLIPNGEECVSALFADPRVHRLIEQTLANRGGVAAMPDAEPLLESSGFVTSEAADSFFWQRGDDLEAFANQLINYLE